MASVNMAEEEENTSSDSTDAFSDKFDSLKALYSDKLRVPVPDAPLYDNINKFESVVMKGFPIKAKTEDEKKQATTEKESKTDTSTSESKATIRKQLYSQKNVVSRMQKTYGPLAMLYQYMENKTRVKIYTRSINGIRGHIEAYIAAFDKHWNLALEDCLEHWTRKIKRKSQAPDASITKPESSTDSGSTTIVKQRSRKVETLERHVPQLLLRGEQVVLIIKID